MTSEGICLGALVLEKSTMHPLDSHSPNTEVIGIINPTSHLTLGISSETKHYLFWTCNDEQGKGVRSKEGTRKDNK